MKNFEISFSWIAVQSSKENLYAFPESVSKYLRNQYTRPAIYRWVVKRDNRTSIYIGETENLTTRLYHYLKPGPSQKTNKRVREFLDVQIAKGASIKLETLGFESFVINGREYSAESLGEKEVRCFLENLLITQIPPEVEKLNRLISVQEKVIRRTAKLLRPDLNREQAEMMARAIARQIPLSKNRL